MAPIVDLIQTEKAYNLKQQRVLVVSFRGNVQPNKIQVARVFRKHNLDVVDVNIVRLPAKVKRRRRGRQIHKRPVKYYVKLKEGKMLSDNKLEKILSEIQLSN